MPLIKRGRFIADPYSHIADDEQLGQTPAIVSLARWRRQHDQWLQREIPIGVKLGPADSADELRDALHRLSLIEIEFPKFRDGRGYSTARILRQRYSFAGEIRASGEVLRDQWLAMYRCGFDSFVVRPATRIEDFKEAMREQSVFYQTAADRAQTILAVRHKVSFQLSARAAAE